MKKCVAVGEHYRKTLPSIVSTCGHDAPYRCEICLEYYCIDDMYLCCKVCHRTFACHFCGFYVRKTRLTCKDHKITDPENCLNKRCLCRDEYDSE